MDINSGFIAAAVILVIAALLSLRSGIRDIQSARKLTFFRLRQRRLAAGWRLFGFALVLAALAFALPMFGEPVAYEYFPPSPTVTLTPSLTLIPTITFTPSITLTPSITTTPAKTMTFTPTSTPCLPLPVVASFHSSVTPNPLVSISSIRFSTALNYPPSNTNTVFQNPVGHLWGIFSYDQMTVGAQWTAIWYRDGIQVNLDTMTWNCQRCMKGGWGETDWNPPPYFWLPGNYEVQIFVGEDWKVVGRFIVQGNPPPTATLTMTSTPTKTPRPTSTP